MLKTGLSVAHFRRYIPLIEQETDEYFKRWGNNGEKSKPKEIYIRNNYQ